VGLYPSQMLVRPYSRSLGYDPFREGVMSFLAASEASPAGQFTENETRRHLSGKQVYVYVKSGLHINRERAR
jgi:hypothetical protein